MKKIMKVMCIAVLLFLISSITVYAAESKDEPNLMEKVSGWIYNTITGLWERWFGGEVVETKEPVEKLEYKDGNYTFGIVKIIPSMAGKDSSKVNLDNYFNSKIEQNGSTYRFGLINKTSIPSLVASNLGTFSYTISGVEKGEEDLLFTYEKQKECPKGQFACNEYYTYDFRDIISKTNSKYSIKELEKGTYKMEFSEFDKYDFDPSLNFTNEQVEGIAMTPLTNNTFVLAWCDETADDIEFKIYDTNGTEITNQVTVDATIGSCDPYTVSVTAFNSTNFIVGYIDMTDQDSTFKLYNYLGNNYTGEIDVDTSIGTSKSVSVSTFNSTNFIFGYYDDADADASFKLYNHLGQNKTGEIDVSTDVGYYDASSVSLATFNYTNFIFGYYTDNYRDVTFKSYNYLGNNYTGEIDVDTDVSTASTGISIATFNSTNFVFGYYDQTDADASFKLYNHLGQNKTGEIDVNTNVGTLSYVVSVAPLNMTNFVFVYYDQTNTDASFKIHNNIGNNLTGEIDSSTTSLNAQSVSSQLPTIGIGICNNSFIHAYATTTTKANWTGYTSEGAYWDGNCPTEASGDTSAPTWTDNSTNITTSSVNGSSVIFGINWTDETSLNSTTFSWNGSLGGALQNDTALSCGNKTCVLNVTKTINITKGNICWRFYANDSTGNCNQTSLWCEYTCTPIWTNTTWGEYTNTSICYANNSVNRIRNLTTYDSNICNLTNTTTLDYNISICDNCTPSLTNTSWGDWSNTTLCQANDTVNQIQNLTTYDQNYCGEVQNQTLYNYSYIFCDYCLANLTNTTWGSWANVTCLDSDTMNETRNLTMYDYNNCGDTENVTFYEYQNITECDFCTPNIVNSSWSAWYNTSICYANNTVCQTQNLTQYDDNYCGEVNNVTFYNYTTEVCDNCTPSLTNTTWSIWYNLSSCYANNTIHQEQNLTQYDQNKCGEVSNTTFYNYTEGSCTYPANLQITWVTPTANANHTKDTFQDYIAQVCCYGANCGVVNVSLDPSANANVDFATTIYVPVASVTAAAPIPVTERQVCKTETDNIFVLWINSTSDYAIISNSSNNGTTWQHYKTTTTSASALYTGIDCSNGTITAVVDSNGDAEIITSYDNGVNWNYNNVADACGYGDGQISVWLFKNVTYIMTMNGTNQIMIHNSTDGGQTVTTTFFDPHKDISDGGSLYSTQSTARFVVLGSGLPTDKLFIIGLNDSGEMLMWNTTANSLNFGDYNIIYNSHIIDMSDSFWCNGYNTNIFCTGTDYGSSSQGDWCIYLSNNSGVTWNAEDCHTPSFNLYGCLDTSNSYDKKTNSIYFLGDCKNKTGADTSGHLQIVKWNSSWQTEINLTDLYVGQSGNDRFYMPHAARYLSNSQYFDFVVSDDDTKNLTYFSVYLPETEEEPPVNTAPNTYNLAVNSTPKTNTSINCTFSYSDLDSNPLSSYEVIWYNQTRNITGQTSLILALNKISKGDLINCSIKTNDGTDWSSWNYSSRVTVANTAPIVRAFELNPATPSETDNLTLHGRCRDDDAGDIVTMHWSIFKNGVNQTALAGTKVMNTSNMNVTTIYYKNLTIGDIWNATGYCEDGTVANGLNISSSRTIGQQLKGGLISTTAGTTPFYTVSSNPENITLNQNECINVTWSVNATGTIGNTYEFNASAYTLFNESISNVTIKINITIVAGETIIDTSPPLWYDNSSNSTFKYNQPIILGINFSDNNKVDNITFAWNGSQGGALINDSSIVCNNISCTINVTKTINFTQGKNICWKFYAEDNNSNFNVTDEWCFNVANTAPQTYNVSINDTTPTITRTLNCSHTSIDADSDALTPDYRWYNQSGLIAGERTLTLSEGNFTKGDTINCSVSVNDGTTNSTYNYSSYVTILNTAPTLINHILNSTLMTNETNDNLTCYMNGTDIDADPLIYYFKWYVNGSESLINGTIKANSGTMNYTSLDNSNTSYGDNWTCSILAGDGTANTSISNKSMLIIDTTFPYFTTIPSAQTLTYGNNQFNTTFIATDENSFNSYSINWTSLFLIDNAGYLNNTASLSAGTYVINVAINDSAGNYNYTNYTLTVAQANSSCSLDTNSPIIFPKQAQVNISCSNDDGTIKLYRNNVDVTTENGTLVNLTAGTYNYTVNISNSINYSFSQNTTIVTISKATPSLSYYLNGLTENITVNYLVPVNASGAVNEGNLIIYRNGTNITNSLNYTLGAGYWRFDYNVTGNTNYTNISAILYATINKVNSTCTIGSNSPLAFPSQIQVNASCDNIEAQFKLYRNDTDVTTENGTLTNLSVGTWNYTVNITATQNYTFAQNTTLVTIIQANTSLNYYLNGLTQNITVAYSVPINASATSSGGTIAIYRNGTSITDSTNYTLAVGNWRFDFNVTGNINYSNASAILYATVIKANSTVYTYLNNSRANISISNNTEILLNGSRISGEGDITLYLDGNVVCVGTANCSNLTAFNQTGLFNITTVYGATNNYSSSYETWWVNVSSVLGDITPPVWTDNSTNITTSSVNGSSVIFGINWSDETNLSNIIFSWNGSLGGDLQNETLDNLCYQETANVSTDCGGVNTGIYSFENNWISNFNATDGNWNTFAKSNEPVLPTTSKLYINYTKPVNALSSSLWKVKIGSSVSNISIPTECWNQEILQFLIEASNDIAFTNGKCYNGTTFTQLDYSSASLVYEEAMWWMMKTIDETTKVVNITKTINITKGNICWRFYANDSTGNCNQTSLWCEYTCTPIWDNTSYGTWTNLSSCYANNTIHQVRNLTRYDSNLCNSTNTTFYNYTEGACVYDSTSPLILILSPQNITYNTPINYTINATDLNGIYSCWWTLNGASNTTLYNSTKDIYNNTAPAVYSDNTYTVYYYCNDTYGNIGTNSTMFTVDTTPPTLIIDYPLNNGYYSTDYTGYVNVTTDGADNCSIGSVNWDWNSGNGTFFTFLNNSFLIDAGYHINVTCNDSVGNSNSSKIYFVYDTTAPEVSISNGSFTINNNSFNIYFNSTEGLTSSLNCSLYLNNILYNNTDFLVWMGTDVYIGANNVSDGNYSVNLTCSDDSGNLGYNISYYAYVDSSPPLINLIEPINAYSTTSTNIIFSYNVTDASSISNCSLIINGVINTINTSITKNTEQNFTGNLAVGSYNWIINCTDSAGNTGNSTSRSLTITSPAEEGGGGGGNVDPIAQCILSAKLSKKCYYINDSNVCIIGCPIDFLCNENYDCVKEIIVSKPPILNETADYFDKIVDWFKNLFTNMLQQKTLEISEKEVIKEEQKETPIVVEVAEHYSYLIWIVIITVLIGLLAVRQGWIAAIPLDFSSWVVFFKKYKIWILIGLVVITMIVIAAIKIDYNIVKKSNNTYAISEEGDETVIVEINPNPITKIDVPINITNPLEGVNWSMNGTYNVVEIEEDKTITYTDDGNDTVVVETSPNPLIKINVPINITNPFDNMNVPVNTTNEKVEINLDGITGFFDNIGKWFESKITKIFPKKEVNAYD